MAPYINSPFGLLNMYNFSINAGVVVSVVLLAILYFVIFRKFRCVLFILCYGAILIIGRYASTMVRAINDGFLDRGESLIGAIKMEVGSHFLGHIFTFFILFYPVAFFLRAVCRDVFGFSLADANDTFRAGAIAAFAFPIQHIFNRLGCLCRGCCNGISYNGRFAINLPYNPDVEGTVFPSQILEMLLMAVLFIVLVVAYKKGLDTFGIVIMGFGITFFISEFFIENPFSVKHFGLTYVQLLSIFIVILSLVYMVTSGKVKGYFIVKTEKE